MQIIDIKIGKTYRVKKNQFKSMKMCNSCINAKEITIKDVSVLYHELVYFITETGKLCSQCIGPKDIEPLTPTCFEELYEGCKVYRDGEEFEVLFANGRVAITSDEDENTATWSKREFHRCGFELPPAVKTVTELTMDEIAKKFDVDVKNLKIKKD